MNRLLSRVAKKRPPLRGRQATKPMREMGAMARNGSMSIQAPPPSPKAFLQTTPTRSDVLPQTVTSQPPEPLPLTMGEVGSPPTTEDRTQTFSWRLWILLLVILMVIASLLVATR